MSNFTLIIPIFNRFQYLPSLIERYKDINLLFIDSSTQPFEYPRGIRNIILKDKLLYESLQEALKYIETDYICWNNDDDIVLESFIEKAVIFLEANKDYSNVLGLQIKPNSMYGINEFWSWYENDYYSTDKKERIDFMMNFFHTPAHAVMTKKCLADACSIPLADERLFPIKYFDRILGITQACEGNKKVLPYISLLRRNDRMIEMKNYPQRLRRNIKQSTMVDFFKTENALSEYLRRNGLSKEEIKSINFNNKIIHKKLLPTSEFKVTDPRLIGILKNLEG